MEDDQGLIKAGAEAVIKPLADLLNSIAGPAAEEIGLTFRDSVRVYRLKRQIRLLRRAKKMIDEAGITPKRIPLRVLLPLIESASIEEDDSLQDRWAALLANNAAGDYVQTLFPDLLRQLSPADATLLRMCFHEAFISYNRFAPPWLSNVNKSIAKWHSEVRQQWSNTPGEYPWSDLSIENLIRLGLLKRTDGPDPSAPSLQAQYMLTYMGYHFAEACEDRPVLTELRAKHPHG